MMDEKCDLADNVNGPWIIFKEEQYEGHGCRSQARMVAVDEGVRIEFARKCINSVKISPAKVGFPHKDINSRNIIALIKRFMKDQRDLPRIFIISTHGNARNELKLKDGENTAFYLHQITAQFSYNSILAHLKSVQKLIIVDACR